IWLITAMACLVISSAVFFTYSIFTAFLNFSKFYYIILLYKKFDSVIIKKYGKIIFIFKLPAFYLFISEQIAFYSFKFEIRTLYLDKNSLFILEGAMISYFFLNFLNEMLIYAFDFHC